MHLRRLETVYASFKTYFDMIVSKCTRIVHSWRGNPPPPPTPSLTTTLLQILNRHVLHVVAWPNFFPFSWNPYVVRFVHSLFRGSRAISRHQNSFRAQPPSQVLGQWRTANENREEQQCWGENQQRLKKQEMTTILTETSLFTGFFAVCLSFALLTQEGTSNHKATV